MILVNSKARPFEIKDVYGETITLQNQNANYVLLSFMKSADCPFCNLRLMELLNYEEELAEYGIKVYLFYHATQKQLKENMGKLSPTSACKMIPDPDLIIHELYETEKSYFGFLKSLLKFGHIFQTLRKRVFTLRPMMDPPLIPADFLIDSEGNVLISHYGKDYTDNLYIDDIFAYIASEAA